MHFVLFYHSLVSDWNHGNAHFLRGVVRELRSRGHTVAVHEPYGGWSRSNLVREQGREAIYGFSLAFPGLNSVQYDLGRMDLDVVLDGADVVLIHEWTAPDLVMRIGHHRRTRGRYRLLFHDTHHRSISEEDSIAALELDGFDGVLTFGEAIRQVYLRNGWSRHAWTWHEAADTALFRPMTAERTGDLVWIGNWGDGERTAELHEFLLRPIEALGLKAAVYGVRYPAAATRTLAEVGAHYCGYLPNHRVPEIFAHFALTVHVPRRPYVERLPGIPTIRVFEALACGIPLICSPWQDTEGLFSPDDFLIARDGSEMTRHVKAVLADEDLRAALIANGLASIHARHTCAHRVDELLTICDVLQARNRPRAPVLSEPVEAR